MTDSRETAHKHLRATADEIRDRITPETYKRFCEALNALYEEEKRMEDDGK